MSCHARRAWAADELQQLRELSGQGKNINQIARALKRSASAIATRLSKRARRKTSQRSPNVAGAAAIDAFLRKPTP